jgi:hypothetical protein
MEVTVVYNNKRDREFLDLSESKLSIFVEYINSNTKNGKKKAYQIKSEWGAKLEPFVVVTENNEIVKTFYSEESNAIQQLISWLNESKSN